MSKSTTSTVRVERTPLEITWSVSGGEVAPSTPLGRALLHMLDTHPAVQAFTERTQVTYDRDTERYVLHFRLPSEFSGDEVNRLLDMVENEAIAAVEQQRKRPKTLKGQNSPRV